MKLIINSGDGLGKMIKVGHKWVKKSEYIGRGTPLGNPFVMENDSIAERNRVCDSYEDWFNTEIENKNEDILEELRRLYRIAIKEDLVLGCFCYPKRCHGETIKRFLDGHING